MKKLAVILILHFLLCLKLFGDEEKLKPKEYLNELIFFNSAEKSDFYYEINTNFYIFNTPVKVLGYYDSKSRDKDWLVVLSTTLFNLPICYYIDGSFYTIDIRTGKISCVKDAKYKLILSMQSDLPILEIVRVNKLDNNDFEINLKVFFNSQNLEVENKENILKLSSINLAYPFTHRLMFNKNSFIKSFEVISANTFLNFNIMKIEEELSIKKLIQFNSLIKMYIISADKFIIKEEESLVNKKVTFENLALLRTFIISYNKIYASISSIKLSEKLNENKQENYSKNFTPIYFDFLKFLQKDQNYKKWYDYSLNEF